MGEGQKIRERRSRRGWWLAAVIVALTGCGGDDSGPKTEVVIVDDDGAIADETVSTLKATSLPDDHALIVVVASLDQSRPLGPQADQLFDDAKQSCESKGRCSKKGIAVILDRDGTWPQVRVGADLLISAAWRGAIYGPAYTGLQQAAVGLSIDEQASYMVDNGVRLVLQTEDDAGWIERLINRTAAAPSWFSPFDLRSEIAEVSYPGSGFFDSLFVKPFLRGMHAEGQLIGTWFVLVGIGFLVIQAVVRRVLALVEPLGSGWYVGASIVLGLGVAFIAVPISWSTVLLSSARMEDAHDVRRALGEPVLRFGLDRAWRAGLPWWAVAVFAVLAAGDLLVRFASLHQFNEMTDGAVEQDVLDQAVRRFAIAVVFVIAAKSLLPFGLCVVLMLRWGVRIAGFVALVVAGGPTVAWPRRALVSVACLAPALAVPPLVSMGDGRSAPVVAAPAPTPTPQAAAPVTDVRFTLGYPRTEFGIVCVVVGADLVSGDQATVDPMAVVITDPTGATLAPIPGDTTTGPISHVAIELTPSRPSGAVEACRVLEVSSGPGDFVASIGAASLTFTSV